MHSFCPRLVVYRPCILYLITSSVREPPQQNISNSCSPWVNTIVVGFLTTDACRAANSSPYLGCCSSMALKISTSSGTKLEDSSSNIVPI